MGAKRPRDPHRWGRGHSALAPCSARRAAARPGDPRHRLHQLAAVTAAVHARAGPGLSFRRTSLKPGADRGGELGGEVEERGTAPGLGVCRGRAGVRRAWPG